MFRIVQILNNNVAVVHTQDDQQLVLMGRGVAFNKKKGDLINGKKVEKVFQMKDEHSVSDLNTLMANIPLDFISVSYELIEKVQKKYDFYVESYINVTLTMHLFAAYERLKKGNNDINYLPNLSSNYPVAYQIADDIINGFSEQLHIEFPVYERKSIAFHFINAHTEKNNTVTKNSDLEKRNFEIVNLIKNELQSNGIERTKENSSNYDRLLIHLKYYVERLNKNQPDNLKVSSKMIGEIESDYKNAWKITNIIGEKLFSNLRIELSMTEKVYLAIHIQRLL